MLTADMPQQKKERTIELVDFIHKNGGTTERLKPLAGDCSNRKYYRLYAQKNCFAQSVIVMETSNIEEMNRFIKTAQLLHQKNLRVPEIYASSPKGFALLEDFGDQTYKNALNAQDNPKQRDSLWTEMLDILRDLQEKTKCAQKKPANDMEDTVPLLSNDILMREVDIFLEWGLSFQGQSMSAADKKEAEALWTKFLAPLKIEDATVLTLRDFHTENIMRLKPQGDKASNSPNSSGEKAAHYGLLDFQDAVLGHPSYDLVSLIEDVRLPFNPKQAEMLRKSFANNQKIFSPDIFDEPYAILSLQRATKIFGIFCRLALQYSNYKMLEYLPNICFIIDERLKRLGKCALTDFFQTLDLKKRLDALVPSKA